jgi:hypothetical protein
VSGAAIFDREWIRQRRVSIAVGAGVLLLALVETATALIAPLRAPDDADWKAAAASVRSGFRPGDLIVAAPDWADQVMRMHLGDLVPLKVAARLDDARYGRVWEISQKGGSAGEGRGTLAATTRHGALTVRRWERPPAAVSFDFFDEWNRARVARVQGGREIPCEKLPDRFQCPDWGFNFVKPQLLEIGTTMRNALYAQPVAGATVAVEFAAVPMGRELAVGAGLHHVWRRRDADGTVELRVLVDGLRADLGSALLAPLRLHG